MNSPESKRIGQGMIYLAWLIVLVMLTLFFNKLIDRQQNPNRDLAVYGQSEPATVVLKRNRQGHYIAPGYINGEPVRFLLDTGATSISIPAAVAERLALTPGRRRQVSTANGTISVFDTDLAEVRLGNIVQTGVAAHINPYMHGETVLLGMSFMKHLELRQQGDTLTLYGG